MESLIYMQTITQKSDWQFTFCTFTEMKSWLGGDKAIYKLWQMIFFVFLIPK